MPKIDVLLRVKGLNLAEKLAERLRAGDEAAFKEFTAGLLECLTQPECGVCGTSFPTSWPCDSVEVEDVNDVA